MKVARVARQRNRRRRPRPRR